MLTGSASGIVSLLKNSKSNPRQFWKSFGISTSVGLIVGAVVGGGNYAFATKVDAIIDVGVGETNAAADGNGQRIAERSLTQRLKTRAAKETSKFGTRLAVGQAASYSQAGIKSSIGLPFSAKTTSETGLAVAGTGYGLATLRPFTLRGIKRLRGLEKDAADVGGGGEHLGLLRGLEEEAADIV